MKLHLGEFIAFAGLSLLLASCAQTGAPLPPSLELPKPPSDVRASRKGSRVTLTWNEPTLTTDRQSIRYIGPTLVCRGLESGGSTTEMNVCGNPVGTLPAPPVVPRTSAASRQGARKPASPRPAIQNYTDTLPSDMQQQNPSAEVTYAIEVLNRNSRSGGLSNRVQVPAIATLAPPSDLAAKLNGDGVVLTWTSMGEPQRSLPLPTVPSDSSSVSYRYRIYRHQESRQETQQETSGAKNSGEDAIAGELPIGPGGPARFTDSSIEWEKTYLYRITAVSIIKRSESEVQVEGDDSPLVRVIAHDVFPPDVPTGLQAAYSGEGQKPYIDLIWAPSTNADLAGYNIFRGESRSETNDGATEKMIKLNSDLVKTPSYRDFAVASGKTYIYSVSAVDVRGNESARSEVTSEPVP